MSVIIHFLNGNDESMEYHYSQKEYRDDVIVEIDNIRKRTRGDKEKIKEVKI